MGYTVLTAAEAAAMIKHNENIALSGFTPAGVAKAVTKELAKIAVAEHEAGREFKVGIFTGASTGQSTDGDLANAQAIKYRAPYTTNPDFRKHVLDYCQQPKPHEILQLPAYQRGLRPSG